MEIKYVRNLESQTHATHYTFGYDLQTQLCDHLSAIKNLPVVAQNSECIRTICEQHPDLKPAVVVEPAITLQFKKGWPLTEA